MRRLNSKEVKNVIKQLTDQFDCKDLKLNYTFFKKDNEKLFLLNKEINIDDFKDLSLNSYGLYFGKIESDGIRLSIEGSQIIGEKARKNVLEIKNALEWFKGKDIDSNEDFNGWVIIKNNGSFLGCGKYKEGKILNFVPKSRRIFISGE